ncbi:MAG TPA: ribonuclease Z [Acidimicrobiales bacterium]
MSGRDLVVLGTASQAPTRYRNHNGYLLRWDGFGVLFDPGEGSQRQLLLAGVPSSAIDRICLTHLHGDHCLGLPGVLARMALDLGSDPGDRPGGSGAGAGGAGARDRAVEVFFPAESTETFVHLVQASLSRRPALDARPSDEGVLSDAPPLRLTARRLDHRVPTLGYRLEEPDGRTMLPDRLRAAGVEGPDVGRLQREGRLTTAAGTVRLEDVSVARPGQAVAFVMDTRPCAAARELAAGVDLLVCESTFLTEDEELAHAYHHMTAAQAGRLAREAGARRLVLTHFSQRHPDESRFAAEAAAAAGDAVDVIAARDLDVVPVPTRTTPG